MQREYRICWNASSNSSFHGATDWTKWEGPRGDGDAEIIEALSSGSGVICDGLSDALETSGFDWWVETRELAVVSGEVEGTHTP